MKCTLNRQPHKHIVVTPDSDVVQSVFADYDVAAGRAEHLQSAGGKPRIICLPVEIGLEVEVAVNEFTVIGFYEDTRQRFTDSIEAPSPQHAEIAVADTGVTVVAVLDHDGVQVDTSYAEQIGSQEAFESKPEVSE